MSSSANESSIRDRVAQRPAFSLDKLRETSARELIVRFVAGALTSVVAGLVTLAFGARVGGILLGFPAIMAASLTLIEEEDDAAEAREDARGGIVAACALTLFAALAALSFGPLAGGLVLLVSTAAWAATALLAYVVLWWR